MKQILVVIFSLLVTSVYSQTGTIRGTIIDDATGETLIGVTVIIKNTTNGASTDLDGKFSITVAPGTYELQVSYISFQTLTVSDVVVKANEVTVLDNIRLKESSIELGVMVVTAEATRQSESALLTLKKKSVAMMDGISDEKMQQTGDATAVEAAKRVTGVSIEGGKYVYVRGLGDRYSKTTLNGMDIPGLDPDKNSLQMDIFPTNLINNMMISKNFTAEMPADFTGGMLNIETKDFPEKKILSVSAGIGFNPSMNFNSNYLTYDGSSTDFLGFDDGQRALPDGADATEVPTPISGAPREETVNFINGFNKDLAATRKTSLMDYSLGLSMGNQYNLYKDNRGKDPKIGYIFSLSYKSDYKFYDDVEYGEYQRHIESNQFELQEANRQTGELGEHNVLVGVLAGVAYKTRYTKIRLTGMRLQNGESRAGKFEIFNNPQAVGQSGYYAKSDNLEYNQRSLTNVLLNGTHYMEKSKWEIDWRLSPTFSTSEDPDIRKTAFTYRDVDTSFVAGAGGNPARIWRNLNELNAGAKVDITKEYKIKGKEAKLKFGASHYYKQRDYEILFFDMQFFGSQSWTNPDPATVLNPENLFPNRPNSIYYQSGNNTPNPNAYESNVNNTGVYISNEFSATKKLKTILGIRAENFVQRHTGRDQSYASGNLATGRNLDNDIVLESLDFFPSVNLIYALTDVQNLRASYSKTIARPSFKELSFAQILDPITNRIFNGSLFTYSDWDGKLTETRIDNIDLRWELFLKDGQIFSVSTFYKKFDNPIELVRIPEQQTSTEYQPRNVGQGQLYGLEFELRKSLLFISPFLNNVNFNGNVTFVESQIDMTDREYNSRKGYEKDGQNIGRTRQMAGQAPYVINTGLSFNNADKGLDVGVYYNVNGPTLQIVGAGLFPDIYQQPFHSVNVSLNKRLGEEQNTTVDFKVSNLLNDKRESFYQSYKAADEVFSRINPGMSFSVGISHKF